MPYIPGYIFALVAGGVVLYKYLSKQDKERSELPHLRQTIEQMGWGEEFEAFKKEHPNYSEYKAYEKFLTPEKKEQVEQAEKHREEAEKYFEEKQKKENIMNRIYGYQYEDFLFSLFAPLATYNDKDKQWDLYPFINTAEGLKGVVTTLPESYVLYRIASEFKLSENDSRKLFKELVQHKCLFYNEYGDYCELGRVLTTEYDIVSANDMNISKWIEKHGQPMTREVLLKESEKYKKEIQTKSNVVLPF